MTAMQRVPAAVGRFELRRMLGRGAQATVWLAWDPRLEREVAVKLLGAGGDSAAVGDWLHEARNVSRLTHPHIVPVFEADVHDGKPYLVFEYVAGPTLAEKLRQGGALAPRIAVELMQGVLDALAAAHAAGVVHRDLKPSNILIDAAGRARVMDFGIAARVRDGAGDRRIVGTPGYMSPEAAAGAAPAPSMDVFAAGMLLGEMLAGAPLLRERDPHRAIRRVMREDMALPDTLSSQVDDALRGTVLRAVARDPAARLPDVAAFQAALNQWLRPEPVADAGTGATGTLDFLLRRMRHKTDFPALSDAVNRIQRIANSENESVGSLSAEILKDIALTNKLLRLVNTAHYTHAGGGSISTISRAVALIGFAGIRNMALSLVLLEHMSDKAQANQLKEEFLRSLMAGMLAGELCPSLRESEEAFLGAMFQNLGRLLAQYYFPDEANRIRDQVRAGDTNEIAAALAVLGLSYEDLGAGVARSWGLPETLRRAMCRPAGDPPARAAAPRDRGAWLGAAANDLADVMLQGDAAGAAQRIEDTAERYARALAFAPKEVHAAADRARERLAQTARALNLTLAPASPAQRLIDAPPGPATLPAPPDTLTPHELQPTVVLDEAPHTPEQVAQLLVAGIQDVTNTMASEGFKLNEVLRMILETMWRALAFRRVLFCLRDPKTGELVGRFGLGEGADKLAPAMRVALRFAPGSAPDLFGAVCLKGADTLIADAGAAPIATRLPAWYRQSIDAPTFLLLPLAMKGAPFGLIYADRARAGAIELGEKELSLLRTLRNQALMAFRQAG
jgi:serine/threonine protein kinase